MSECEALRERALGEGTAAVATDPDLRRHLASCEVCQRFLADLDDLDEALRDLPPLDASDELVARTAQRVQGLARPGSTAEPEGAAPPGDRGRPLRRAYRWLGAAAAGVVLGALALAVMTPTYQDYTRKTQRLHAAPRPAARPASQIPNERNERNERAQRSRELLAALQRPLAGAGLPPAGASHDDGELAGFDRSSGRGRAGGKSSRLERARSNGPAALQAEAEEEQPLRQEELTLDALRQEPDAERYAVYAYAPSPGDEAAVEEKRLRRAPADASAGASRKKTRPGSLPAVSEDAKQLRADDLADSGASERPAASGAFVQHDADPAPVAAAPVAPPARTVPRRMTNLASRGRAGDGEADGAMPGRAPREVLAKDTLLADPAPRAAGGGRPASRDPAAAQAFLAGLERVDGLRFQTPRGYWQNTYVPGDPAMRLLRTRLGLWRQLADIEDANLEGAVRAVDQPLDVPRNAGMALFLQTDKAAVSGPARVRLQVGLQGALRSGARPSMNVSLVLDLGDPRRRPSDAQLRAVVEALAAARQPGDRFTLSASGPAGGFLVQADDFRHGPLQMALSRLLAATPPAGSRAYALPEALRIAAEAARGGDDPGAAFGSSLVLLVTAGVSEAELPALETLAHEQAVGGIALSVVDAGPGGRLGPGSAALERLVAAGQGQRRDMPGPAEARRVVEAELQAAGRAVARAARLRIRLARGVRLVEVVGSRRLAEPQAQRVREAERSIDRRLARNLGIEADRGEDEAGIQIVIPSFFAGDSHVILLDLVVEGPGPVAEVTLRYKDLVHLENGVARAEARLAPGERDPGPLQRNVLKNRVAFEVAAAARAASRMLERGQAGRAAASLERARDLLDGLRATVSGWSSDPELAADAALLSEYIDYLRGPVATGPARRRYAAESLRYAAFRKLAPVNEEPQ